MKSHSILFLVLSLMIGLSSCKSDKPTRKEKKSTLNIASLDYEYLSSKARVNYKSDEKKMDANVDIRIAKDSILWISVRVAAIEGLRVKATKSQIEAMDKMNKKHYNMSYEELGKMIGVDINYDLLQSMVTGDFPYTLFTDVKASLQKDHFLIEEEYHDYLLQAMVGRKSQKLEQLHITPPQKELQSLNIAYDKFKNAENTKEMEFPFSCEVKIEGTKYSKTVMTFNRVRIEEEKLRFPFKVPSKYQKVKNPK